jgi:hypothetical protein
MAPDVHWHPRAQAQGVRAACGSCYSSVLTTPVDNPRSCVCWLFCFTGCAVVSTQCARVVLAAPHVRLWMGLQSVVWAAGSVPWHLPPCRPAPQSRANTKHPFPHTHTHQRTLSQHRRAPAHGGRCRSCQVDLLVSLCCMLRSLCLAVVLRTFCLYGLLHCHAALPPADQAAVADRGMPRSFMPCCGGERRSCLPLTPCR